MEKKYVKPEMVISEIEMDELCNLQYSGNPGTGEFDSKHRGGNYSSDENEEWFIETDLWGNESWTRVE